MDFISQTILFIYTKIRDWYLPRVCSREKKINNTVLLEKFCMFLLFWNVLFNGKKKRNGKLLWPEIGKFTGTHQRACQYLYVSIRFCRYRASTFIIYVRSFFIDEHVSSFFISNRWENHFLQAKDPTVDVQNWLRVRIELSTTSV